MVVLRVLTMVRARPVYCSPDGRSVLLPLQNESVGRLSMCERESCGILSVEGLRVHANTSVAVGCFTPCGSRVLLASLDALLVDSRSGETCERLHEIEGVAESIVTTACFSSDGQYVLRAIRPASSVEYPSFRLLGCI